VVYQSPPPAPKIDPDLLLALGDGALVVEQSLYFASTRVFVADPGTHAIYAARLTGMVMLAAAGIVEGSPLSPLFLEKHVRSAGIASKVDAVDSQWGVMTVVVQAIALSVGGFAANLARSVTVTLPN